MTPLSTLVKQNKIIVTCGTGGVGKTTVSAALALRGAIEGRNTLVITIDPAKRLATSLGLDHLTDTPTDLTESTNKKLLAKGEPPLKGRFYAVVPDSKKTFETLVKNLAKGDENIISRVLKTSIYKIFTQEFSGAHEYMAMEKLYELSKLLEAGDIDLIVLDTPPSAHTSVFLSAPHRLASFFDENILKWLTAPGGKFMAAGAEKALDVMQKLTGSSFVRDLVEFAQALFALRVEFLDNLKKIGALLKAEHVSFVMVTSPVRLAKNDTQDFVDKLKEEGFPFYGFIMNRVLGLKLGLSTTPTNAHIDTWANELEQKTSATTASLLKKAFQPVQLTLQHEEQTAEFLKSISPGATVSNLAEQNNDVHCIEDLYEIAIQL